MTTAIPPLARHPIQQHFFDEHQGIYTLHAPFQRIEQSGDSGVTTHAIRRFRRRIMKLPRRTVIDILQMFLHEANMQEGEALFDWHGQIISVIIRNSTLVTVMKGPDVLSTERPYQRQRARRA